MRSPARFAVLGGLVLHACGAAPPGQDRHDLVVYGGTAAGVVAAVQAARMGLDVVLVEPGRHLGGMTSGGLGATDTGNQAAVGGLAREFYRRIRRHYDRDEAWRHERREDFPGRGHRPGEDAAWTFEPSVAEAELRAMLGEARVPVVLGERLDLRAGVAMQRGRIAHIATESGRRFAARMFVDATYEGDLMALAGVSYTVGREANAEYGETLNGVQTARARHHQFVARVDPYVRPGVPGSGLLPGVQAGGPGRDGGGDRRVQAYCYRLCTTDVPANRRPWPRPPDYDAARYELLLRNFEAGDHRVPWHPVRMPNRKTDTNNNFAVSTDHIGGNHDYPEADHTTRARIAADHRSYQQGLMWTLANHPRVPDDVRRHFGTWGLARDEFVDNDNWPHQLYVREARRMVSDVVMTELHCRGVRAAPDPVGLGAYGMDSHHVQRYVAADGAVRNEGDVQVHGFSPYGISYRSIVPAAGECPNLLVPVCVSASHIAFGSIRMEPVFMVLGQSAATAAGLALRAGVAVQDVSYQALRARLLADRQVLEWTGPARRLTGVDPGPLPGVVLDDERAELTGAWVRSTSVSPHLGLGYRHDGDVDKEGKSARFALQLARPGEHEVRIAYTAHHNRASNVPVRIACAGEEHERVVDQREPPPIDGLWLSLGVFSFADRHVHVTVSCSGTDGHVVVDGVQVLPVR